MLDVCIHSHCWDALVTRGLVSLTAFTACGPLLNVLPSLCPLTGLSQAVTIS